MSERLVALVTELTSVPPYKRSRPSPSPSGEDGRAVVITACCVQWCVAPRPGFGRVRSPVQWTMDVPVVVSGLFLRSRGWTTTRLAGLQRAAQRGVMERDMDLET